MTDTPTPLQRLLAPLRDDARAAVAQRFERMAPLLQSRLASLYGAGPAQDVWFGRLMQVIGDHIQRRPPALLALDAQRALQPDWFVSAQMLGYSAYVDRFGGTLRGVAERIPHLQSLGVTYLHLLPFLRARAGESDGGFAVASFDEVDPAFGSNDDLEALTAQLRGAGISLCADLILNHVADDHPWAQGAASGDARLRDYFHVFPDRALPDRFERTLGQVFPEAAPGNFTYVEAMQGWVWTTFYPFQWDLNYANPAVLADMIDALLRLANRGVEVFRLDSTAFLWKREGSACMNLPECHLLLQVLRAVLEIAAPGVLLKAEAIVPTRELPAYFGDDAAPECHLAYHSTLMTAGWAALAEQDTSLLRAVIAATPSLPLAASWLSYVRCHDDIGWSHLLAEAGSVPRLAAIAGFFASSGGYAAGVPFQAGPGRALAATNGMAASLSGLERAANADEREAAVRRLMLVYGLALSFGALPVLYMGDELGMQNAYAYAADPARAHDTRWVQRAALDEMLYAARHDEQTIAGQVFASLRRLIGQRQRCEALAAGAPRTLLVASDPALLAMARGEHFLSLANFSARTILVDLRELGGSGTVTLAPWAMQWLDRASGQPLTM